MTITTARLEKNTLKRIQKHGMYGESVDTIVNKILDEYEKKKGGE